MPRDNRGIAVRDWHRLAKPIWVVGRGLPGTGPGCKSATLGKPVPSTWVTTGRPSFPDTSVLSLPNCHNSLSHQSSLLLFSLSACSPLTPISHCCIGESWLICQWIWWWSCLVPSGLVWSVFLPYLGVTMTVTSPLFSDSWKRPDQTDEDWSQAVHCSFKTGAHQSQLAPVKISANCSHGAIKYESVVGRTMLNKHG